jgi:hypothetical protein
MAALSLAWTAAFALLGLVVLRLRMPRPAGAAQPAGQEGAPLAGDAPWHRGPSNRDTLAAASRRQGEVPVATRVKAV